jgi:hypothetical protein
LGAPSWLRKPENIRDALSIIKAQYALLRGCCGAKNTRSRNYALQIAMTFWTNLRVYSPFHTANFNQS